jgi:hypothetical protein
VLRAELDQNIKGKGKRSCQLMVENALSRFQKDDSWRKPTHHVEVVENQANFSAQPSVLSTYFLTLTSETIAITTWWNRTV